jgi:hypothetical protein
MLMAGSSQGLPAIASSHPIVCNGKAVRADLRASFRQGNSHFARRLSTRNERLAISAVGHFCILYD